MSNKSPTSGFWIYVAECVRLLYWAYFKPYTYERWLRDIHPELQPRNNPFDKKAEFRANPRLRRYAGQVWWVTLLVPFFVVLLIAPVYTLVSGESSRWFFSFIFFLGWVIGMCLEPVRDKYKLAIFFLAFLTTILRSIFLSGLAVGVVFGLAVGVVFGVAFDLALGVVRGVALGLAFGLAFGLVIGVAVDVAIGVVFGVVISVALGVVISVAIGVVFGVAFGVAFGLALILGVLRFYFWLVELLWTLFLFFFSPNGKQVNCLRYIPPRFDELIILPLPFLDQMIVEAYRENPSSARETIDYLTTSTNQQKVAVRATIGITADILNGCQRLEDILDIANQLTWIPSPPPKELGLVLPQFLDISQSVRASQAATTSYRRYELLNPPINALQELKNNLAFGKNASLATKFGSIAERWLRILQTAQRILEETAKQSQEIRQVYIAGNSLEPQTAKYRFKGRIDIFREIETLTLSDQSQVLLLYGGRRTGKTSALKYLPYRIAPDIIPLLVDLQGTASATTLKGFAENLARQIIDTARRLPRTINLPNPDAYKLAEDPFPALQTWLGEIERSNSGKRFLLCLDEFERLSEVVNATNSRAPLNFIRHLLQHQKQWILLFSGSHQLSELDAYWSDYLINTRALRMTYLQESEARELILKPVEDFTNIYEPEAVDMIIQITRCQPYLVQLVCYELVELLNRDIRANRRQPNTAKATVADVQDIIPTVLERGDQYFRELWTSLENKDQSLLRRLIDGETPTPQDSKVVKKLARKEILTPEGNAFQVPLVQKFVEYLLEEE